MLFTLHHHYTVPRMADNGDEPEAEQMQMEKLFCPKWKSYLCDDTLWS